MCVDFCHGAACDTSWMYQEATTERRQNLPPYCQVEGQLGGGNSVRVMMQKAAQQGIILHLRQPIYMHQLSARSM